MARTARPSSAFHLNIPSTLPGDRGSVQRSGVQRRSRGPELTVKRTTVAPRRAAKLPFGATPARRAEHRARLRPLQRLVGQPPPLSLLPPGAAERFVAPLRTRAVRIGVTET